MSSLEQIADQSNDSTNSSGSIKLTHKEQIRNWKMQHSEEVKAYQLDYNRRYYEKIKEQRKKKREEAKLLEPTEPKKRGRPPTKPTLEQCNAMLEYYAKVKDELTK